MKNTLFIEALAVVIVFMLIGTIGAHFNLGNVAIAGYMGMIYTFIGWVAVMITERFRKE